MTRTRLLLLISIAAACGGGARTSPPAASAPAAATPETTAAPSPAPAENPEAAAVALAEALRDGRWEDAAARFDDAVRQALPAERLAQVWQQLVGQVGPLSEIGGTSRTDAPPHVLVVVDLRFRDAELGLKIAFDERGRVAGLFFLPAQRARPEWQPPPYARPDAFREKEVTVGSGEWALPGTLTMPVGPGPHPAVVLVHGSGPHDRDETIGPNKPFCDLAWGLASRGVAVLRYEKRTKAHAARLASARSITLNEEVVDDAVAAVALLRRTSGVDPRRVYVLGHSLGAMLAPKIGRAAPGVAGLVLLAGPARPVSELLLEQFRYLAGLDGEVSPEEQAQIDEVARALARVRDGSAPDDEPLLGVTAGYWREFERYDAPADAAALKLPMLILQGGRDYQVTVADFELWKRKLGKRRDVVLELYPDLNHLFMTGAGRSTPAEYDAPGHVAEDVVRDVATWVTRDRKKRRRQPARLREPGYMR